MLKKGLFFSTDALIALITLLFIILLILPISDYYKREDYVTEDIMEVLSNLKIGEVNNSYIQEMKKNQIIKNPNLSVLEAIGEFYVNDVDTAKKITEEILSKIEIKENMGIWYGNQLIYMKNKTPLENARNIKVSKQFVSGIKEGESTKGYSARTFLKSSINTDYYFFGGYIGEGNISVEFNNSGEITGVLIEVGTNKDFDIYINEKYSGHYSNSSSNLIPRKYSLDAYISNLNKGINKIEFVAENLHIAGGYIKISYLNTTSPIFLDNTYNFPGIEGAINIYGSFYIPENLNEMEILLKFNSPLDIFLSIGNKTIFKGNTSGEDKEFLLSNEYLTTLLNYSKLSKKTTPIRIGISNRSILYKNETIKKDVDVMLVTDLSGSMCGRCINYKLLCCLFNYCSNNQEICEKCSGNCTGGIYEIKNASKSFIDEFFKNDSDKKRVGIAAYRDYADSPNDFHTLSNSSSSLKSKIDSLLASGGTCICCGINRAVKEFLLNSNNNKSRFMIVMSDGIANRICDEQGTNIPINDSIKAACDAYNKYGIRVYSVGFGPLTDEYTLKEIAKCGNGTYYYSDIDKITEVYQEIARKIIEATTYEQTIIVNMTDKMLLYPDSYIKFNYNQTKNTPYGLKITLEKIFSNNVTGYFEIPKNTSLIEAKAVSYSGSKWTSLIKLNNNTIYNLSEYNMEYLDLGDPYLIYLPAPLINEKNNIEIYTGVSRDNISEGSSANKVIYTVSKDIMTYSPIVAKAVGCIWKIDFEDGQKATYIIPRNYTGENLCFYTEEKIENADENDAINLAVLEALSSLDFDKNGKVDILFPEQDLGIDYLDISNIPFSWATKVDIISWD